MLKVKQTKSLSKKEVDVVSLEGRRASAESEFVIIANDSKRLKAEQEELDVDILKSRALLSSINKKRVDTNKLLLENELILKGEEKKLTEIKSNYEELVISSEKELKDIEKKKLSALSKTSEIIISNDLEIFKVNQEIKDLKIKKGAEVEVISVLENNIVEVEKLVKEKDFQLVLVSKSLDEVNKELILIKKNVESEKDNLDHIRALIKNNESDLGNLAREITDKKTELGGFDGKIEDKKKEYNDSKHKLFTIADRMQALTNKEAFIKAQYEKAGVNWED